VAERITQIAMQAFRGVPHTFALDLPDGQSCVILGNNGTGKSAIADAVEWYFNDQVEFLAKEGRATAIRHTGSARNVKTQVTISTNGSLGGAATKSHPAREEVLDVGRSESFILRGRTLADFVDKTKGEKWSALSQMLGLDPIDQLRRDLQHARNALESQSERAAIELDEKRDAVGELVTDVSESGILGAFEEKCQEASVAPPESFEEALDPRWIQAIVPKDSPDQRSAALQTVHSDLRAIGSQQASLEPIARWNQFVKDSRQDILPLELFKTASSLLESIENQGDQCPLCGQPVDPNALAERVAATLVELEKSEEALAVERQAAQKFVERLSEAHQKRVAIAQQAKAQDVQLAGLPHSLHERLFQDIADVSTLGHAAIEQYLSEVAVWDAESVKVLESSVPAPATSKGQSLIDIGVLHTQAKSWNEAIGRNANSNAAFDLAERIFNRYQELQRDNFDKIIRNISGRTAEIYQYLHPEEGVGAIGVKVVGDKGAELEIEFHGITESPPHRVLSESHMNSLGLALFLAMAEAFNEEIGFLVLDDVVSSFDREHRGRLAELLIEQFEDTQLLVLTHDEQFFTRLSNLAPSWSKWEFTSWSYNEGPRTRRYESDRIYTQATEALNGGDRIGAAQKGRRALEEFLQEACERLEAPLPFRRGQGNDHRTAQEVMNGLRRKLKDVAKPTHREVSPLLALIESDLQAGLNVESHATQGAAGNLEIQDALDRIGDLHRRLSCSSCNTRIWHVGTPVAARCKCGEARFPPPPEPK